jgi:hypothetical protein
LNLSLSCRFGEMTFSLCVLGSAWTFLIIGRFVLCIFLHHYWRQDILAFSLLSLFWGKKKYAYEMTFLSVCMSIPAIKFRKSKPVFMKLGMYIMTADPISTV